MTRAAAILLFTLLAPSAPPALAEIAIGTAGPMTGSLAVLGQQMKTGAGMAVSDINAAGGVLGEQLVLVVGDDLCNRKDADAVANRMAGRRIAFMAGHLCSGSSMTAATVYAEAGIVEISPAASNPTFTEKRAGPGIFRLAERDDRQGTTIAGLIAARFKDKRIAIVHDDGAWGKALADDTAAAMGATGLRPTLTDTYQSGEKDYTPLVSRLKDARIEVVFIGGLPADAGLIARQMRAEAMTAAIIGGDAVLSEDFWHASGDAGEGTLVIYPSDPTLALEAADLVKRFRMAGLEPEGFVLPTYAAVQIFAEAAKKAGSTDFDKLVAAIAGGTFDTVLGKVSFDEKGDMRRPGFAVYEWKAGRYFDLGN